MDYPMFCYQCEQTAGGKGCTKMGICVHIKKGPFIIVSGHDLKDLYMLLE